MEFGEKAQGEAALEPAVVTWFLSGGEPDKLVPIESFEEIFKYERFPKGTKAPEKALSFQKAMEFAGQVMAIREAANVTLDSTDLANNATKESEVMDVVEPTKKALNETEDSKTAEEGLADELFI